LHLQPALGDARGSEGDLPVTEELCREALSLPLYPELPLAAVDRIANAVKTFCLQAV
jgi:dTDP-4-amino-4,6-dideoxygalactose transaminase